MAVRKPIGEPSSSASHLILLCAILKGLLKGLAFACPCSRACAATLYLPLYFILLT